jgi:cupin fold WbuC family metalloprotein
MKSYKNLKQISDEVFQVQQDRLNLSQDDIIKLVQLAEGVDRQRVRFCGHQSRLDRTHEMFIVHPKGAYVRPHKHVGKSESILILEGRAKYFVFDEDGRTDRIVDMGNLASGKTFYQKIGENTFHTFLIHSEWLVFLEITSGPFFEEDTIFAPWSPDSGMAKAVDKFLERLAATGQAIPV